jgi:hypothetical protein
MVKQKSAQIVVKKPIKSSENTLENTSKSTSRRVSKSPGISLCGSCQRTESKGAVVKRLQNKTNKIEKNE